jgi:RimJ/RimL family protein N-acetyltransferase
MMLHIGGPRPEAEVRAAHKRRLDLMEQGVARMLKIVADDSDEALGTVGIWKIGWKGPQAYEMGWFVLPEHQGKGVATEAVRLTISQARSYPGIRFVYAFPAVTNVASNAIARKIGMSNQGEFDSEGFAGVLRCNDWCIDLGQLSDIKNAR